MTTVAREIPFSFIQFPMWERMKKEWAIHQGTPLAAWQGALCGSISGAISAAATTPLDVCKTRLMIDTAGKYSGMIGTMYVQACILILALLFLLFVGNCGRPTSIPQSP